MCKGWGWMREPITAQWELCSARTLQSNWRFLGSEAPCRCYWQCLDRMRQTPSSIFVTCASGRCALPSDASTSVPLLHTESNSNASCIYVIQINILMEVNVKFLQRTFHQTIQWICWSSQEPEINNRPIKDTRSCLHTRMQVKFLM